MSIKECLLRTSIKNGQERQAILGMGGGARNPLLSMAKFDRVHPISRIEPWDKRHIRVGHFKQAPFRSVFCPIPVSRSSGKESINGGCRGILELSMMESMPVPSKTPTTPKSQSGKGAAVMIQGTGSGAGKSLLTAILARFYTRSGLAVRPFKPQNMSNNATVCADGGEIGRAQAMQAMACGVAPLRDMNPILLKPQSGGSAQIIVNGDVSGCAHAREWRMMAGDFLPDILAAYHRLAARADLMLVEGAGSPSEVNLVGPDIANMVFAEKADVPVILVVDIERGGALAALVGTYRLLSVDRRRRIKGYIINKFRGDQSLLAPAFPIIRHHCGWDCLGVMPWSDKAHMLPAEDSLDLAGPSRNSLRSSSVFPSVSLAAARGCSSGRSSVGSSGRGRRSVRIVIPKLPHIANFDDFDPLSQDPGVDVIFADDAPLPLADLIILPGSKAVIEDMRFLRKKGWDIDIKAHARRGGWVLGICAGFQMLGRSLRDDRGLEGVAGTARGLGLLHVSTVLGGKKTLGLATARHRATGVAIKGYEMHLGVTRGPDCRAPCLDDHSCLDAGAVRGRVEGLYLHGIFSGDDFRRAYLNRIKTWNASPSSRDDGSHARRIDDALNGLSRLAGKCLDTRRILAIAGG